jgi:hypothetical protein
MIDPVTTDLVLTLRPPAQQYRLRFLPSMIVLRIIWSEDGDCNFRDDDFLSARLDETLYNWMMNVVGVVVVVVVVGVVVVVKMRCPFVFFADPRVFFHASKTFCPRCCSPMSLKPLTLAMFCATNVAKRLSLIMTNHNHPTTKKATQAGNRCNFFCSYYYYSLLSSSSS